MIINHVIEKAGTNVKENDCRGVRCCDTAILRYRDTAVLRYCGTAGSMMSTFKMALAIRRSKMPLEFRSMNRCFIYLFQVDEETMVRDRRRLPMVHSSERLVDKSVALDLLFKHPRYAEQTVSLACSPNKR